MELKINKDDLMSTISSTIKAIPAKSSMPILGSFLITAENDEIHFIGNDLEMSVESICTGDIEETGEICVDAHTLANIVSKLPNGEVSISTDAEQMLIRAGKAKFNISVKSAEDYPKIDTISRDKTIEITSEGLKDVILQTIFSISPENSANKIMTGELFSVEGNTLTVTALDGHRIAIREMDLGKEYEPFKAILPGKTLMEISRILTTGDVNIFFTSSQVVFEFNNSIVTSRLIEGEYFAVDQMLNDNYDTKITVDRQELAASIERATLLWDNNNKKPVILTIDEDLKLEINTNMGSMNEDIEIEKDGNPLKIGVNPKFLLDALRVINDSKVTMYFTNAKAPIFIKNDGYIYLILPVNFHEGV